MVKLNIFSGLLGDFFEKTNPLISFSLLMLLLVVFVFIFIALFAMAENSKREKIKNPRLGRKA